MVVNSVRVHVSAFQPCSTEITWVKHQRSPGFEQTSNQKKGVQTDNFTVLHLKISLLFKCRFEGHKKFSCLDSSMQLLLIQNHNCSFMVWLSAEMQMVSDWEAKVKGSFLTLTVQLFFQGLYFSSFLNQFDESFFIFIIISINCHSYSTGQSHKCYLKHEID